MTIFYNAKTNAFYDSNINKIPEDSIEVSSKLHAELLQKQSEGLEIHPNNGYPVAIERTLTAEEIQSINSLKKQELINNAKAQIKLLQRAIKYNIATNAEKKLLEQLELFTINIDKIDLSDTNVVFPDMPE